MDHSPTNPNPTQTTTRIRPDLLLSRSGRFAALHWGFPVNYFMVVDLQASAGAEAVGSSGRILDRGPAAGFAWFGGWFDGFG